jgi:serine/threonine protein kinase
MPVPPDAGAGAEKQLRQACAELDRRLRAGERCRAERFFAAAPLLASQEDWAVELIYTEFVAREELGRQPAPEEFYARFPHWRERLRRQFELHELLRDSFAAGAASGPAAAEPPRHLGGYELLGEIAHGGCGMVYRAWQQGLDRIVALKALRPELGRLLLARQRFCHEARVMAALRHRHIMPVHDIGESQGFIYFSMDYAPGSLAQRLRTPGRRDELPALLRLLEAVARAVHHAHRQDVIHCDLKPSNVLLDAGGEPLVSDFGLARLPRQAGNLPHEPGLFVGTPAYMAPEQVDGGAAPLGPATDVWAMGVMLYELVAGRRPFEAATLADLQEVICQGEPPGLGPAEAGLEAVCRRCLAKEPAGRYASALELADALHEAAAAYP